MRRQTLRQQIPSQLRCAVPLVLALLAGCTGLPATLETPRVQVTSLTVTEGAATGQRFDVRLVVDNPNAVAISVATLGFELHFAGEGMLVGRSTAAFTLPASGQEVVTTQITRDLLSSLSRLLALVQGPAATVDYELTGDFVLAGTIRPPLPFQSRGEVPLAVTAPRDAEP